MPPQWMWEKVRLSLTHFWRVRHSSGPLVGAFSMIVKLFRNLRLKLKCGPRLGGNTRNNHASILCSSRVWVNSSVCCIWFESDGPGRWTPLQPSTSLSLPSTGSGSGLKGNWIKRLFWRTLSWRNHTGLSHSFNKVNIFCKTFYREAISYYNMWSFIIKNFWL